jgi:hypothetical protein
MIPSFVFVHAPILPNCEGKKESINSPHSWVQDQEHDSHAIYESFGNSGRFYSQAILVYLNELATFQQGSARLELYTVLILAACPVLVLIYNILVLVGWYFSWYFEH